MKTLAVPDGINSKLFVMEKGALADLPEVLHTVFPNRVPWLVADGNTWEAAGKKAAEILKRAKLKTHDSCLFPGTPTLHPDKALSEKLLELMPPDSVPVAVGSGVINDLVKCAAGMANLPYCCCPTAASVDGYTSSGAAMVVGGMKITVPCPAPLAVVADLDVLDAAPPAMAAAGYADLFAKVTGGADWIIADTLGIEPIDPAVWSLVHRELPLRLEESGDKRAIFAGLAATGYAMQLYRDSRPASGAEHLMSHIWEMEGLTCEGESISHGFKVGIGMIAAARLLEFVIDTGADRLPPPEQPGPTRKEREAEIDRLLIRGCYGDGIKTVAMQKFSEGKELAARRRLIRDRWDAIRAKLQDYLIPSARMIEMLKTAHCPTGISEIGLGLDQFAHGIRCAQLIRKRYTVLDLLYESGLLETAVTRILKQYR